jgi:hypothetical protein
MDSESLSITHLVLTIIVLLQNVFQSLMDGHFKSECNGCCKCRITHENNKDID